ncbi:N-acetylneuraminate synthase family protein [Candidatus Pelagibacter sp. HIMB1495]|uniref:N-acetylneuraminate synthase family protein n=1 Tax=unclassified Candidatus Pelagibacter TaxID=2647897 RepID=UPI003F83031F
MFKKFIKPYFIAEIGSNFNQDLNTGYELIKKAKMCGADAVKFQLFKAKKLYPNNRKMFRLFKSIELSENYFHKFYNYAKKLDLDVSASTFDLRSAKYLSKFKIDFHKIASSELTNYKLIEYLSKSNLPILLSTGMSDIEDIKNAVKICENNKNLNIVIMQCGSDYPLKHKDVNLNTLKTFRSHFQYFLGFSDHTLSDVAGIASVSFGSTVFEKHITLSKKSEGPDHFFAMEPEEFKDYIFKIKEAYKCLGTSKKNLLKQERLNSRRKGLYFNKDLKKGKIFTNKDYVEKSPPIGLTTIYLKNILNKRLIKSVKKNNPIFQKLFD